jgi:serine/threonine protein phosphatase PrpC
MQVFQTFIDDHRFGDLHPQEDALLVDNNVFAVADGITRDPLGVTDFTGLSKEEALQTYPNPSPAKFAADAFVDGFVEYFRLNPNSTDIKAAFEACNHKIATLNADKNPNPDYLINDYWACVAAGAVVKDYKLYWGNVGDCNIRVLSSTGEVKLITTDSVANFDKHFHDEQNRPAEFDWRKPEWRRFVRQEYRNNSQKIANGEVVGYGALTGELTARPFMNFGELDLMVGDYVLIYSDGFESYWQQPELREILQAVRATNSLQPLHDWTAELAPTEWVKFGREKSLILALI